MAAPSTPTDQFIEPMSKPPKIVRKAHISEVTHTNANPAVVASLVHEFMLQDIPTQQKFWGDMWKWLDLYTPKRRKIKTAVKARRSRLERLQGKVERRWRKRNATLKRKRNATLKLTRFVTNSSHAAATASDTAQPGARGVAGILLEFINP